MRPLTLLLACALALASAPPDALAPYPPTPLPESTGVCAAEPPATATLRDVRAHLRALDDVRATAAAETVVATSASDREREAARFAWAALRADDGDDSAAADLYGEVRRQGGPLRAWAAAAEAEALLRLGQARPALAACAGAGKSLHEAVEARCARVRALALAELGQAGPARAAAAAHDREHRGAELAENVERTLVLQASLADPEGAVGDLVELALDHGQPLTGRIAEERLAELVAAGLAASLPDDTAALARRARRLRDDLRRDEAWAAFQAVAARRDSEPWVGRWLDDSLEHFASRTHRFDTLVDLWQQTWADRPDAAAAWGLFRVSARAGDHEAAAKWARVGVDRFAGQGPWSHQEESVGVALLRAGDWKTAVRAFDAAARRSGPSGRRAALLGALATGLGGDAQGAMRRLSSLAASDPATRVAAHYWRARFAEPLDLDASADRDAVRALDPHGWYALNLDTSPGARDGRFATHEEPVPADASVVFAHATQPPSGYPSGAWWDEAAALESMADTARRHRDWAGLDAAHDLASVGLYDLAGPLVGDLWELARRGRLRGSASDRDLSWRALLFAARDHHHVARTTFGLWEFDRDAAAVDQAWQLGWPVAHERAVWRAARTADVDPWLVLGLMRQESTYDPTARSPVGARGAMQVMPRTGWLLADQRDDRRFTPADLDDPSVAVAYGVDYLGRLLDRFDGVWPVAVAAYNAGPTRVAQWLGPTRLPIDLWVELIPVRETRDYVRKVGAGYARYAALYAVDGVSVPDATGRDLGPDVVDF